MGRPMLIFLLLVLGVPGCASLGPQMDLQDSSWRVEDISGRGVLDRVAPEVIFRADGQLIATGGCNRFFGSWRLGGDRLTVRDVAGTKMACPEAVMHEEDLFLTALSGTRRLRIESENVLVLTGDERSLRLHRTDPN